MDKRKRLRKKKIMNRFVKGALRISDGCSSHMKRKENFFEIQFVGKHKNEWEWYDASILALFFEEWAAFKRIFKVSMSERLIIETNAVVYKIKDKRVKIKYW